MYQNNFTFAPFFKRMQEEKSCSYVASSSTHHNTPPMPLSEAHLGGLFFLGL
ncbi:MAG: hypothetical protein K0R65_1738 [Crocinitomicaceae bacterium]|jgi:hypothetical protein|nr:hypothetical protein [Crocinitomicaceae bacterium]